jgi:hypothetical protein
MKSRRASRDAWFRLQRTLDEISRALEGHRLPGRAGNPLPTEFPYPFADTDGEAVSQDKVEEADAAEGEEEGPSPVRFPFPTSAAFGFPKLLRSKVLLSIPKGPIAKEDGKSPTGKPPARKESAGTAGGKKVEHRLDIGGAPRIKFAVRSLRLSTLSVDSMTGSIRIPTLAPAFLPGALFFTKIR